MKAQEAINILNHTPVIISANSKTTTKEYNQMLHCAEEALEKQIPKKPYYFGDGYANGMLVYDEARCPACECDFEEGMTNWGCKFCPDCGQALDWSDME